MYLCCNRSKPETVKYTVRIDQSYRDNRRFSFQCNFKTAGFKVTDMIAVIKIIPTLREQDITFSILNIFRYFIDNGQRLTYIFFIQPLSLQQINKLFYKNGIGFCLIHNDGTRFTVCVNNSKRIILALMIRVHHVTALFRKILLSICFRMDSTGNFHQTDAMSCQLIAFFC